MTNTPNKEDAGSPFWVSHITEDEDDHTCVRCCQSVSVDFDTEWLGPDDNFHFNICNDCAQNLVAVLWDMVKANAKAQLRAANDVQSTENATGALVAAPCSALAAPDSAGYWWLMAFGKMDWELIKVTDFGDGRLSAGAVSGNWFGLTIGRGFSYLETRGRWVKIHKPNAKLSNEEGEIKL